MAFWAATSGTWINLATVLAGCLLGARLRDRLQPSLAQQWRRWLGLITLLLAIRMVQPLWQQQLGALPAVLPALVTLVLGASLGQWWQLDQRLRSWLCRFQPSSGAGPQRSAAGPAAADRSGPEAVAPERDVADVLAGTFVLFCVGPMTLLGCLRNGALGEPDLLLVKACLDGLSAALLASGIGLALAWVLLPMAVLQLSLCGAGVLLAGGLPDPMASPALLFSSALGGVLVLALALELLDLPHPSSVNALPALLLAPLVGSTLSLSP